MKNQFTKDFVNQMFSSMFNPLISKPARITNTSATLIDNIFVNVYHKCGILYTDLWDHLPVFQIASSLKKEMIHIVILNIDKWIKKTVDQLRQDLENEEWNDIYDKTDPQEAYNYL